MTKIDSDYSIQKLTNKVEIYHQNNGFWWSDELSRWMCTDTNLIKEILNNPIFAAPTYSVEKIVSKLSLDLGHNIELVKYFPVAQEGEAHKLIRKRHALQMIKNSDIALDAFEVFFERKFESLLKSNPVPINLYEDLLLPSVNVLLGALAEIDSEKLFHCDSISQVLDETLSLGMRVKLNQRIGDLINLFPDTISKDEKYFRISMIALGSDSLLGTISESLVHVLELNPGKLLSEIEWPDDVPVSGVPVIERLSSSDYMLNGTLITAGQKLRLYLDATGHIDSEMPYYSKLYFGAGSHVCLGMPLGRKVWKCMKKTFENINKKVHLNETVRRKYDNVFNLYNVIKINIYD